MKKDVTLLDGAIGTILWDKAEAHGVEKEPVWKYNIEHPEFVEDVTREYLDAGSEIVLTNTFGANRPAVNHSSSYTVDEVITAGVTIAKNLLRGTKARVCLDIGPLSQLLEPYGPLKKDKCAEIYDEMMKAGVDAGCDMIMMETFMDLEMMRIATLVAQKYDKPVFCSMTFEKHGKTIFGNPVQSIIDTLSPLGIDAIGLNCSLGPIHALPIIKEFSQKTDIPLILKPNAGKPILSDGGSTTASYSAEQFVEEIKPALKYASYIGGCCGSDPSYISGIKKCLEEYQ